MPKERGRFCISVLFLEVTEPHIKEQPVKKFRTNFGYGGGGAVG